MKKPQKKTGLKKAIVSSQSGADNREHHRVPIQLLVDYKADGHFLFDFCRDLGVGGVFIHTKNPQPLGSKIDLTFTIPDSKETLTTKGNVIWVQPKVEGRDELTEGMGVQFDKFSEGQRQILENFIERHNSKQNLKTSLTDLKSA